ncbi:MAG TPA: hypothetical protein VES60_05750, partial [Nakamurella sp.]|nr:hypothetical protein [Nakamurella sp.]
MLAAGAVAAAVNDEVPDVLALADDVPVLDDAVLLAAVELSVAELLAAVELSVAELSLAELSVAELLVAELLVAELSLAELSLAEATASVAATWASPTVTPAVARAAAPTTPTVTCRTLRRSARPDLFLLPWVMGTATSQRRNSASELTPSTFKYRAVRFLCGSRPAAERVARLFTPMVAAGDGVAFESLWSRCGANQNPTDGLIRPPGSVHPSGGHQLLHGC